MRPFLIVKKTAARRRTRLMPKYAACACDLSVAAILAAAAASLVPAVAAAAPETSTDHAAAVAPAGAAMEAWRSRILHTRKPSEGCFTAKFPVAEWVKVPCRTPSHKMYPPRPGGTVRTETVGGNGGTDFSAQVTGHITQAQGSFDSVTGVTSEKSGGGVSNGYTLQLNTDVFKTSACTGAPDPACRGWEQFVYDSGGGGAMQYWLLNYGAPGSLCPLPRGASCKQGFVFSDGWCPETVPGFSDVLCAVNAVKAPTAGAEPATSLQQVKLTGAAGATGTADEMTVTEGATVTSASGGNYFPDLGSAWQVAEFNIFGPGGLDTTANFNTGSTLVVRTGVVNGTSNAPTCDQTSFTAESNNLTLVATTETPADGGIPSLVFTESNAPGSTQSACATAVSLGDTHVTTFDGLHYDFQAAGEFVLLQDGSRFVVQARQASGAPTWPNAAVNKAVAVRLGQTRVALYVEPARLVVDGAARSLDDGRTLTASGGTQVTRRGTRYVISDATGDSVRATLNPTWIDIVVGLGHTPRTAARGLLGNPRGDAKALTTAKGVVLKEPVAFNDLYHTYADSWRVPAGASLFDAATAVRFAVPEKPFFAKDLTPEAEAHASQACKTAGVTNEDLLEDCKLDATVLDERVATRAFLQHPPILRHVMKPVMALDRP